MRRAGFQHFGALAAYGVGLALTALPGRQYLANGEQFEQWSLEQHGDGHINTRAWPGGIGCCCYRIMLGQAARRCVAVDIL